MAEKSRITVLLYSVAKDRICFNPLIVVEPSNSIDSVIQKALGLYVRAARVPTSKPEVLTVHTSNAGIDATIADQEDAVIDVLGKAATLTVVVRDADDLITLVNKTPVQLPTPVNSTAPSLDLNTAAVKKRKLNKNDTRAQVISPGPITVQGSSARRRARRRTELRNSGTVNVRQGETVQEKLVMDNTKFSPAENDSMMEDSFEFTRPQNPPVEALNSMPEGPAFEGPLIPLSHPRYAREEPRDEPSAVISGKDRQSPGTVPATQTESSAIDQDLHSQHRELSTKSPLYESKPLALTEFNLRSVLNPEVAGGTAKGRAISVNSSSVHDSHIMEDPLEKQTQSGAGLRSSIQPLPVRETTPASAHSSKSLSASLSISDSDLADYLSDDAVSEVDRVVDDHVSNHTAHDRDVDPEMDHRDDLDVQSNHSSSMDSGHPEPDRSLDEEDSDSEGLEAQAGPAISISFRDLAKSSPEMSQQTEDSRHDGLDQDNLHLERGDDDEGQEGAGGGGGGGGGGQHPRQGTRQEESRPTYPTQRPGLKSTYKSLSFLHDQSLRQRDDLSKIHQSPVRTTSRMVLTQPGKTGVPSEKGGESSAGSGDGESDDASSSSSSSTSNASSGDSEIESVLPAEKRAKLEKRKKKKKTHPLPGLRDLLKLS